MLKALVTFCLGVVQLLGGEAEVAPLEVLQSQLVPPLGSLGHDSATVVEGLFFSRRLFFLPPTLVAAQNIYCSSRPTNFKAE